MNLKEKWDDVSYDIYLHFRPVRSVYYNLKYGIRNLFRYFKVIWNDRDWDELYVFILLNKKFTYMEELHRKYGNSVNSKKYADEIKLAKLLTERIINRDYNENALTQYYNKYGKDFWELDEESIEHYFKRKNDISKQQRDMRSRAYKHADKMEKQDIEYLFKHMSKHIQKWWD